MTLAQALEAVRQTPGFDQLPATTQQQMLKNAEDAFNASNTQSSGQEKDEHLDEKKRYGK
jgi:hypothetical protein